MKGMAGEVADDEQLFRRVRESVAGQTCYRVDGNRVIFSQAAFNDPKNEPSFDRERLRSDPQMTRLSVQDGVVTLRAELIRRIGPIKRLTEKGKQARDEAGKPIVYGVNPISDPRFGDCAHALVVMTPDTAGAGVFKRLKDALARLATEAGWTIAPQASLGRRPPHAFNEMVRCINRRLAGHI